MSVIRVNAAEAMPQELAEELAGRIDALAEDSPIIVMIHGFRFSPARPQHDPHRHILALDPDPSARRVLSWPRALGFGHGGTEGLAIAFGWEARGSLVKAYQRAERAGHDLARLIATIRAQSRRPVALIAHSLGARVALSSLQHLEAGAIGRMILLAGAEFRCVAAAALACPAGRGAEILNITSRENDLFDFGMELVVGGLRRQALGFGLAEPHRNWLDVQIDDRDTLSALSALGFPMEARALRMSHWSPYLRRGVFDFYRTALRQPWALPLSLLRNHLPQRPAPRWSRLLALPEELVRLRAPLDLQRQSYR